MMKKLLKHICRIMPVIMAAACLTGSAVKAEESPMFNENIEEIETETSIFEEEFDTNIVEIIQEEELESSNDEIILEADDIQDNIESASLTEVPAKAAYPGKNSAATMKAAPSTDQDIRDDYTEYISVDNDHVWYQFTTSKNDSYYYIYVKNIDVGAYGAYVHLRTQHNEVIWETLNMGSPGSKSYVWKKLKPNTTYYFECYTKNKVSGDISIYVAESQDDAPDSQAKAQLCKLGEEYTKQINAEFDTDWFSFKTDTYGDGEYELKVTFCDAVPELVSNGSYGFSFLLYDSNTNAVARILNIPRGTIGKTAKVNLKPNTTYYLKVESISKVFGQYQFALSSTTKKYDISNASILLDKDEYVYKSKAIKPGIKKVQLTINGKTVTLNKSDYTLNSDSYSNNDRIGTATVTIYGKGKYTGTATTSFYIRPGKMKIDGLKALKAKGTIQVSWKKTDGIDSFEYRYAKKKSKLKDAKVYTFGNGTNNDDIQEAISKNKKSYRTITDLNKKTTYYIQIRACSGLTYGDWSDIRKVTTK